MKLLEHETLVEKAPCEWVLIRRSYPPATHTYDFRFEKTALYCPHCGAHDVWREDSPGDYYVGPEHRCGACGEDFNLP